MKFYIIRHGESVGNEKEIHQGKDTPLSDIGLFQAKYVAKRFENIHIDIILSSPYIRARQTAEEINKVLKKKIIYHDNLVEKRNPSIFFGKRYTDPDLEHIKKLMRKNILNESWHYSDEENYYDILCRARKFIEALEKRKEKDVLAVTHGIFARAIVIAMMDSREDELLILTHMRHYMELHNTGITLCEKTSSGWKLHTWNDYAHLG